MKSIYFKNFLATAVMVLVSFLMIGVAFVFIGQGYIIKSHRDNMESNAMVASRLTTSLVSEDGIDGPSRAYTFEREPRSSLATTSL